MGAYSNVLPPPGIQTNVKRSMATMDADAGPPGANTGAPASVEAHLVARARGGDVRAFEALYRRHAGSIHATCRRLAGNAPDAEEFTQKAFVQAWESLPRFRGESGFGTWMHRIAVNVALAHRRRALREAENLRLAGEETASAGGGPDGGMDLERAVATLPDGAREVFVLHDVEGYRHDEIAALTGIAVGTSRAQLHRARSLLRERLSL